MTFPDRWSNPLLLIKSKTCHPSDCAVGVCWSTVPRSSFWTLSLLYLSRNRIVSFSVLLWSRRRSKTRRRLHMKKNTRLNSGTYKDFTLSFDRSIVEPSFTMTDSSEHSQVFSKDRLYNSRHCWKISLKSLQNIKKLLIKYHSLYILAKLRCYQIKSQESV